MVHFSINFTNPWFLLLIIPAVGFTLFTYLRIQKKYRNNRNKITSIICHLMVMVLCISVVAGISFNYDKPNEENELIFLVDMSFSGQEQNENKISFVEEAIKASNSTCKTGVVTFGADYKYIAELSFDYQKVIADFRKNVETNLPDDTATNIEDALKFARGLFNYPQTAKIVIVSDGVETDGNALGIIKTISLEGIKVDTVYCPNANGEKNEVQIIDIVKPDYNVSIGDLFELSTMIQSSVAKEAVLKFTDTYLDEVVSEQTIDVNLKKGDQTISISHSFMLPGMHELSFEIECDDDTLDVNNKYVTYVYLEEFTEILVIEKTEGESAQIKNVLAQKNMNVTTVLVDSSDMPTTLDQLCEYDEIILANVAYADMPEGFEDALYSYVNDIGGGLLTFGGASASDEPDEEYVSNAYDPNRIVGSKKYRDLLPVTLEKYTPPLGVMFIIDRSYSMEAEMSVGNETKSKLEWAKEGAKSCISILETRDWGGIMSLDDNYNIERPLIPMTTPEKLLDAIEEVELGGGTNFTESLRRAAITLSANKSIQKRHIILVSDGEPNDQFESYAQVVKQYYDEFGVTLSFVGIGIDVNAAENMKLLVSDEYGHGEFYDINNETLSNIGDKMRDDLAVPEITSYVPTDYAISVKVYNAITNGVDLEALPELHGYYGTKSKAKANVILEAPYNTPLYAQWKVGVGSVGSFMCDFGSSVNGAESFSSEFSASEDGQRLLLNIVMSLFPTKPIRTGGLNLSIKQDNYSTQVSIYTKVEEGQYVDVQVTGPQGEEIDVELPNADTGYSRTTFEVREQGIYKINATKKDSAGNVVGKAEYTTYRAFSYSQEYNLFTDKVLDRQLMVDLASQGYGVIIEEVIDEETGNTLTLENQTSLLLEGFNKFIHITIDPRVAFVIIALVLFLLDIAVRKFKFKWPHEIIRDYKARKKLTKK